MLTYDTLTGKLLQEIKISFYYMEYCVMDD